jgi:hypothetical protein
VPCRCPLRAGVPRSEVAYPIAPACLGYRECALAVRGLSTQSRGRVTREGSLSFTLTLNGTTN